MVNDDDTRRATKVKETDANDDVSDPSHNLLIGFVNEKPTGFIGTWVIDGAVFSATNTTKFEEDDGTFAVGSYVKVEYVIADDVRRIIEIETEVPPGAGDEDQVGELEIEGEAPFAVAAATTTIAVNGVS